MSNNVFVQFLSDNVKKSKFWIYITCFLFGLALAFKLDLNVISLNITWNLRLVIGVALGLLTGAIATSLYKLGCSDYIKRNLWKRTKFWIDITCCLFGSAIAFVVGLTIDSLNLSSWIALLITGGVLGLVAGRIMAFLYKFKWSGFQDKQLWDWMQLLILPILVATGSFLIGNQVDRREAKQTDLRKQQEILRLYFDQMKTYTDRPYVRSLLRKLTEIRGEIVFTDRQLEEIEKIQINANPDLQTVKSLTYTILKELDSERKSQVFRYLYDIGLIRLEIPSTGNKKIGEKEVKCTRPSRTVGNKYVFESAIQLENANFEGVDLSKRNLTKANFCKMRLNQANLSESNLTLANINGADLTRVNLDWAKFTDIEFDYVGDIDWKYRLVMMLHEDPKVLKRLKKDPKTVERLQAENSENSKSLTINNFFYNRKDLSKTNLQNLDFSDADLRDFNLENSNLSSAKLAGADLSQANLKDAILDRVNINDAKGLESAKGLSEKLQLLMKIVRKEVVLKRELRGKDLSNMNLDNLDLTGADLTAANLEGSSMKGIKLSGANLTEAILENTDLTDANLIGAKLVKTNLQNSTLVKARLDKAKLTLTSFQGSNLQDATMHGIKAYAANFEEAKMSRVQLNSIDRKNRTLLNSCSMGRVDLNDANLTETDLISVDLSNSTLQRATMKGANLTTSRLISVDLSDVKELSKATFKGTEYYDTSFPKKFNPKKYEQQSLREIPGEELFSMLAK
ncbi:pentapeptide repeat-containing protein [Chroococcidiopsis sp. FACHB-1243]|uniref:pentapeptide repeat-containing protein n=1 Tax=Chroococcidiopsis sp. [FACHB-1243] TaxID=2692781 RepID=UPI0017839F8C|nr:pentapeptide repeat-containing protein [Chroococcidiopsis sp. [FACHB-1243]]MBD2308628.1 pentapeptide repeat-containing protein [Chroococcidiopsis sp. [FACHB-1243]]